jgi:hypothetical protein
MQGSSAADGLAGPRRCTVSVIADRDVERVLVVVAHYETLTGGRWRCWASPTTRLTSRPTGPGPGRVRGPAQGVPGWLTGQVRDLAQPTTWCRSCHGRSLVIWPEGARPRVRLRLIHPGAFEAAVSAAAPVVPLASGEAARHSAPAPYSRRHAIHVGIGEPVYPAGHGWARLGRRPGTVGPSQRSRASAQRTRPSARPMPAP